ncbi:MAG: hypothetical protein H6834_11165 [Planctomycetes bacterium]|nr:hypothetical protein [Planctomycetota bacterium]
MSNTILRYLLPIACVAWLGTPGLAQEKEPAKDGLGRLDALLQELRTTDRATWEAKRNALRAAIEAHQKKAKELRDQADALRKQATAEDEKAKAVEGEIENLERLVALLGPPETPKAPEKPAMKAEAATKPAEKPKPEEMPAPKTEPKTEPKTPPEKTAEASKPVDLGELTNFEDHMLPVFSDHCVSCHARGDASGGLDLSSYRATIQGGSSGETLVKGNAQGSRLYLLTAHLEKPVMPRGRPKLDPKLIAQLERWIDIGAPETQKDAQRALEAASKKKASAPEQPEEAIPTALAVLPEPQAFQGEPLAAGTRPPVVRTLTASPGAPLLASPGHDQILLRHTETLELVGVLPFPFGDPYVLEFSDDGTRLLAAGGLPGKRGGAVLYDVRTGESLGRYGTTVDTVLAATLSPKQDVLALAGTNRLIEVYDVATRDLRYEITKHADWVLSLDISADSKFLASCDRGGGLYTWELETGEEAQTLRGHQGAVHAVRFRADARSLVSAGADGFLRGWNPADGASTWRRQVMNGPVLAIFWNPGQLLAATGESRKVTLQDGAGRPQGDYEALADWGYAVAIDAGGTRVFTGDWTGELRVYDLKSRKLLVKEPAVPVSNPG